MQDYSHTSPEGAEPAIDRRSVPFLHRADVNGIRKSHFVERAIARRSLRPQYPLSKKIAYSGWQEIETAAQTGDPRAIRRKLEELLEMGRLLSEMSSGRFEPLTLGEMLQPWLSTHR